MCREDADQWIRHNMAQLSRIYPKGSRFGSDNPDPVAFWEATPTPPP